MLEAVQDAKYFIMLDSKSEKKQHKQCRKDYPKRLILEIDDQSLIQQLDSDSLDSSEIQNQSLFLSNFDSSIMFTIDDKLLIVDRLHYEI
jgi:hypothetical protein